MSADLLIELGTEELPPKALESLMDSLVACMGNELSQAQLPHGDIRGFASPRRLALIVKDLAEQQADVVVEKLGPLLSAAFDEQGQPTKAALGFARSCGLDGSTEALSSLAQIDTEKGAKLCYRDTRAGAKTAELIPAMLNSTLKNLPIAKRMHWGSRRESFVRPVHWLVLLLGDQVIPGEVMGLSANNISRGHRVHCSGAVSITSSATYVDQMRDAYVLVDFHERREKIRVECETLATDAGGKALIDDQLLSEVTALTEWPIPLLGQFDKDFLQVPQEALISSMQEHQKYFPVIDDSGHLLPLFITVANIESQAPEQVIAGNERVIRPRFADAKFFYESDLKTSLSAQRERLKSIVYQEQLGSVYDKTHRVATLAEKFAHKLGAHSEHARRAGELSKSDLVSEMVLEFSDLQGVMGRYYATNDGESQDVADALYEQYLPRFAGDTLPTKPVSIALALADRLDTLTGIFGIGQSPSGSKDPFGLRRASLAVLRILIENDISLDLADLIHHALAGHRELPEQKELAETVINYILSRLRSVCEEQGIPAEVYLAVHAKSLSDPLDIYRRILAVNAFSRLPEAGALASINKRVSNLLEKNGDQETEGEVSAHLFADNKEHSLWASLSDLEGRVIPLIEQGHYGEALSLLASLRAPIDDYFDSVMVMVDDEALRTNRCRVLAKLRGLFLQVADVSLLASKAES